MQPTLISRRDIFKLLAAASAAGAMLPPHLVAKSTIAARPPGVPFDPDFNEHSIPWLKPLTDAELATLTVLCDLIIPGDADAPLPSKIGLADFINEWVGAPYDVNIADRDQIRGGLVWLDTRSGTLHSSNFASLTTGQQTTILDSICGSSEITPELAHGNAFFRKLRMLAIGGYYSHSSTWNSLGYVGNIPIAGPYPGVPVEILRLLGLENI